MISNNRPKTTRNDRFKFEIGTFGYAVYSDYFVCMFWFLPSANNSVGSPVLKVVVATFQATAFANDKR